MNMRIPKGLKNTKNTVTKGLQSTKNFVKRHTTGRKEFSVTKLKKYLQDRNISNEKLDTTFSRTIHQKLENVVMHCDDIRSKNDVKDFFDQVAALPVKTLKEALTDRITFKNGTSRLPIADETVGRITNIFKKIQSGQPIEEEPKQPQEAYKSFGGPMPRAARKENPPKTVVTHAAAKDDTVTHAAAKTGHRTNPELSAEAKAIFDGLPVEDKDILDKIAADARGKRFEDARRKWVESTVTSNP